VGKAQHEVPETRQCTSSRQYVIGKGVIAPVYAILRHRIKLACKRMYSNWKTMIENVLQEVEHLQRPRRYHYPATDF